MMKTNTLMEMDLMIPKTMSIIDLSLTRAGLMLACPTLMYFTRSSNVREILKKTEADWEIVSVKY